MEEFNLVGFALYVFASAFTPGPNNILSMSAAGRYGIARAWRVLVGVFAGFIIVMLLCALFSVALASLVPKIMPFMEWAGAATFSGSRGKRGARRTPRTAKATLTAASGPASCSSS